MFKPQTCSAASDVFSQKINSNPQILLNAYQINHRCLQQEKAVVLKRDCNGVRSARVVKTLTGHRGMVQAFHADVKEGWSLLKAYRGMIYLKIFYGGMVLCFYGRVASPSNRVLSC